MSTIATRHKAGGLAKYDPQKGVKKIAVAEMAEKHYARAKDATKLIEAIRAKLDAQAEFVLWWDTQLEKADRGTRYGRNRSDTPVVAGRDGLPDRMTIARWRTKLNDPDAFERTFAAVCAKYPKLLEFISTPAQSQNSGEQEWYTPADFVEAARVVLGGIDLDPASSPAANEIVQAAQIFTSTDDGLTQPWHGRVWMNPPYGQPLISQFCEKLAGHVTAGDVPAAIVLVNNATETQWFSRLVDVASAICFPAGRIRFWSPGKDSASPLQGQAVVYIGEDTSAFLREFKDKGFVVMVAMFECRP